MFSRVLVIANQLMVIIGCKGFISDFIFYNETRRELFKMVQNSLHYLCRETSLLFTSLDIMAVSYFILVALSFKESCNIAFNIRQGYFSFKPG